MSRATQTHTTRVRVATIAAANGMTQGAAIHAARRTARGYVIAACNDRFLRYPATYTDNAGEALASPYACKRCRAGLANGTIVLGG